MPFDKPSTHVDAMSPPSLGSAGETSRAVTEILTRECMGALRERLRQLVHKYMSEGGQEVCPVDQIYRRAAKSALHKAYADHLWSGIENVMTGGKIRDCCAKTLMRARRRGIADDVRNMESDFKHFNDAVQGWIVLNLESDLQEESAEKSK
jgi:hypothetical protein